MVTKSNRERQTRAYQHIANTFPMFPLGQAPARLTGRLGPHNPRTGPKTFHPNMLRATNRAIVPNVPSREYIIRPTPRHNSNAPRPARRPIAVTNPYIRGKPKNLKRSSRGRLELVSRQYGVAKPRSNVAGTMTNAHKHKTIYRGSKKERDMIATLMRNNWSNNNVNVPLSPPHSPARKYRTPSTRRNTP